MDWYVVKFEVISMFEVCWSCVINYREHKTDVIGYKQVVYTPEGKSQFVWVYPKEMLHDERQLENLRFAFCPKHDIREVA